MSISMTKPNSKVKGDVIQCYDCNRFGYVVYDLGGYILSPRWKMARVGLSSIYICDDCQNRRRQMVKDIINKRRS